MPALGTTVHIPRGQQLTRFQFDPRLSDALAFKQHDESKHLAELAGSFGHDVLNLACLAGRLLWFEGVTPEMWRSHDLVAISVDVEAYYVMLQCACDTMADCVATLGVSPRRRGQVPSESFHKFTQWAARNMTRLDLAYHGLLSENFGWFEKINSERTAVVHRGKNPLIYTDRVSFNWGELLPKLADAAGGVLGFSKRHANIVLPEHKLEHNSERLVIDGVYVPALDHLLKRYRTPIESPDLHLSAQILLACGGYVESAFIGYPDGFWWSVLMGIARLLKTGPHTADIHVNPSGSVHDAKIVFAKELAIERSNRLPL